MPALAADHLNPTTLTAAQRHLVAKAISEFAHERILAPEPDGRADGRWVLVTPDGRTRYEFAAQRLALDHWAVDAASLVRRVDGEPADLDAQALVVELAPLLGVPDDLMAVYLEEIAATLAGAAWKRHHHLLTAGDLADADFQTVERSMTEGHPGFVANNGRIGYGLDDHESYAPETGARVRLVWLAARRSLTRLSLGEGLTERELYDGELDDGVRAGFDDRLRSLGLDPDDYLLLPLHPWQWTNKVAVTFAPDVARRDLVFLGEGPDEYQAQQSVRTFFNRTRPERHYVKTALAVQNMGFLRGLSPQFMAATPAINDWVAGVVDADPTLRDCGFGVLRERAAVGYTGDAFHSLLDTHGQRTPYQRMLAGLWRESPLPRLADGERPVTMAALLHRDADGRSLATALVTASGLTARNWLRGYLRAYLRPVVHCLLAHDLAFMPHGENLILVLRDHAVVRAFMKDVGEEVAVLGDQPLPPEAERIRHEVTDDLKALAIHTDVFDGVLRHLAAIWHVDGVLPETEFWAEVVACLREHEADHPDLADPAAALDLFRPEFDHSCLNRLQLRNSREMVDITDQASSLLYAGTLANPIAGLRPAPVHGTARTASHPPAARAG